MTQQTPVPPSPRNGASRKAIYIGIVLILIAVVAIAVFVFVRPNFVARPDPQITDTTVGWDNSGRTYRLYITVHNNGANGTVKIFAEVRSIQIGNVGFAQTQDKTVYLDKGGSTTVAFEFNSDWLAINSEVSSEVSRNVWAIAP